MKTLEIDDKWSVTYDETKNDKPVAVHRHGLYARYFPGSNFSLAMFHSLLENSEQTPGQKPWAMQTFPLNDLYGAFQLYKRLDTISLSVNAGGTYSETRDVSYEDDGVGGFIRVLTEAFDDLHQALDNGDTEAAQSPRDIEIQIC